MQDFSKDASTLENIAAGVDAGIAPVSYGSALRTIAARLRAVSPSADVSAAGDAPAASDVARAAVAAMAHGCAECRSKATGESPSRDTDMMRHQVEGHAAQLAALLDALGVDRVVLDVEEPNGQSA